MPNVARTAFAALALILTLGISNAAYAACSSPAGAEGEMIYNDDFNVLQFCDGTNWISMSGGSGGGGGSGVTDGDKGDITVGSSGASWMIDDDVLDFTELSDAMTLDASTRITVTGSNVLTLTNTGTGASLVVEDQASDTTPFVVAADGKVGIGISSPTQALDVAGKATADSVIYKSVTSTAAPVTGSSMWSTNGTDVWRTSGNFGLGVASPSYPVHVVNSGASSVLRMDTYGTGFSSALNMTHARGTAGSATATQSSDILGSIGFIGNPLTGSAAKITAVAEENFTASTGAASLRFSTRQPGDTGSSNERMRITPTGEVGIGTTAPTAGSKLEIYGTSADLTLKSAAADVGDIVFRESDGNQKGRIWTAATAASEYLYLSSGDTTADIIIDPSGKVGIGTVSPASALDVVGTIIASGAIRSGAAGDHWSPGSSFYGISGLGQLDSHGAYETTLTSNGYRDTGNLWVSYAANSQTGAAQIALSPSGKIYFKTDAVKATGSSSGLSNRMTIAADGKVGIATTAPAYILDVNDTARAQARVIAKDTGTFGSASLITGTAANTGYVEFRLPSADGALGTRLGYMGYSATDVNVVLENSASLVVSGGSVGIGTSSPGRALEVYDATPLIRLKDTVSGASVASYIEIMGADGVRTGYVGDGSASNANMHMVSDAGAVSISSSTNTCTLSSSAAWSCSSDARLKKNVETVSDSLVKLGKMRGVTYEWIDPTKQDGRHYGLIAQEVEKVYPEMVSEDERGMKTVDYSAFVSPLINAVQELQKENDVLRSENESLKSGYADLAKRVEALEAGQ